MEGAAIDRTDSVLRGCGVLKDGAPQDCPEPRKLALCPWKLQPGQGQRRGEGGVRKAGVQSSPAAAAASGVVHRESCRYGWPFSSPLPPPTWEWMMQRAWACTIASILLENPQSAQSKILLPRCKNKLHKVLLLLSPPPAFYNVSRELRYVLKSNLTIAVEPIWGGLRAHEIHWPQLIAFGWTPNPN